MVNFIKTFLGVLMAGLGVFMLIGATYLFQEKKDLIHTSVETTATVTKVEEFEKTKRVRVNGRSKLREVTVYKVRFEYEADGEVFEQIKEFSDPMQKGDTFSVWYDPNDPSDYSREKASFGTVVLAVVVGVALVAGGVDWLIVTMRSSKSTL